MAAPKYKDKRAREAHLTEVARLFLSGISLQLIAQNLGVRYQSIQYDLKILTQRWMKKQLADMDEAKALELERITHLEHVAWQAWERSIKSERITTHQEGTVGKDNDGKLREQRIQKVRRSTELRDGVGNPAFLSKVAWCISQRCRILGLTLPPTPTVSQLDVWRNNNTVTGTVMPGQKPDTQTMGNLVSRAINALPSDERTYVIDMYQQFMDLADELERRINAAIEAKNANDNPRPVSK